MEPTVATNRARRGRHWTMLGVAIFVLVMSYLLQVVPGERLAFVGLSQYPLPDVCMSQAMFGAQCPGCGLSRSIVYLAHGQWQASFAMHQLGWLMAISILMQIPYRIAALLLPHREVLGTMFPSAFGCLLIALLLGNWLVGLLSWQS